MLLDFRVGNFLSFYAEKSISLHAERLRESSDVKECVVSKQSYSILKTLAVYGANSSGKSNLTYAMGAMKTCVLSSVKLNDGDSLPYIPFLLLAGNNEPTSFEVTFLKDGYCYRYGFCFSQKKIGEEWLFRKTTPRSKEQTMFIRNQDGIAYDEKRFEEGVGNEAKVNANRLFLSLCAQLGGKISKQVMSWFQADFNVISGLYNGTYQEFSKMIFRRKEETSKDAMAFFRQLQLGFEDIKMREMDATFRENLPDDLKAFLEKEAQGKKFLETYSVHHLYNKDGSVCGVVEFPLDDRESSGTRKLFDLSGPVFDTLRNGYTLVIDELDAKIHPLISQHIIQLFNSSKTNPNDAQLIFTTHDTHLLSSKMLRRDQIWFTEKDANEQTDLYCLSDIVLPDGTKPRNDANYEKNYIAGRYGAIPYIDILDTIRKNT